MYFLRYVWIWQPFNNTHYSAEFENHLFPLGSFLIGQSWNGSISILAFTKKLAEFFFFSYDSISSKNTAQSKNVETNQKIIGQAFFVFFWGVGGH